MVSRANWLLSICWECQARAAGKDSYNLFTQLGDVRGQAAALLVQSHVCIKSKNQELDFSVLGEINILVGRKTNVIPCMHFGSGIGEDKLFHSQTVRTKRLQLIGGPKDGSAFFRIPLNSIEEYWKDKTYSCLIYRTKVAIFF